ncbi:MAG: hypothetical protein Q7T55_11075, partial [Solirubrobacteraceae bacterium]|nr:hypothetical protein [Solirubrobacteraceae bacterium]
MNEPLVLMTTGPDLSPEPRSSPGPVDAHAHASEPPFGRPVRYDSGPAEAGEATDVVDRLLDDSWDERLESYDLRQRAAGAVLSVTFVVAAVALALLAPPTDALGSPGMIAAMALGFAIASRVEFPIGAGYAVPTQLFLVPLFVLAPPADVPLIVLAAQGTATLVDIARRGVMPDRIVDVGADSWHSFAPALVFTLAGVPEVAEAAVWLFILAFTAQVVS